MNKKTVKQMGISIDKKRRLNKKQMGISIDKKRRLNKKTVKEIKKVKTRRED